MPARRRLQPVVLSHGASPAWLALPWELLQMIFEYFVLRGGISRHRLRTLLCGNALDIIPIPRMAARRDTLRGVCQHWRQVCGANVALWQDVELAPQVNLDVLGEVASRSGTRPLRLHCYYSSAEATSSPSQKLSGATSPLALKAGAAHLTNAIQSLQLADHRWQSLTLYTDHHALVNACLEAVYSDPTYRGPVESFKVVFTGELDLSGSMPRNLHVPCPSPMRFDSLPPLTSLTLFGCRVDWDLLAALLASTLRCLHLSHVLNLVQHGDFVAVLGSASNLEVLHVGGAFIKLDGIAIGEPVPHAKRIVLPALRRLCLAAMYVAQASHLLRTLDLPQLQELWLDLPWQKESGRTGDFLDVIAILLGDDCAITVSSLQVLSLRAVGFKNPEGKAHIMFSFFATLRDLKDIFLDFGSLEVHVWRWLVEACRDGHLPALQNITVGSLSALDVQEFILARRQASLQALQVYMLVPADAREISSPRMWLTWLKRNTSKLRCLAVPDVREHLYLPMS